MSLRSASLALKTIKTQNFSKTQSLDQLLRPPSFQPTILDFGLVDRTTHTTDYHWRECAMSDAAENLESRVLFELKVEHRDMELGALQYEILNLVSHLQYDDAKNKLKSAQEARSTYRLYVIHTEKIFQGACDLIDIIKSKMDTPGLRSLILSQQDEINDNIQDNWGLLKSLMKRLKTLERELATADSKSTLIIVKAVIFGASLILIVFITKEVVLSMGTTLPAVFKQLVFEISGAKE